MSKVKMSKSMWEICHNVRKSLQKYSFDNSLKNEKPLYLVGLSGGVDSLVLAAAAQFEANRKGSNFSVGAVIVNHRLQEVTDKVSVDTAEIAKNLGLNPVIIKEVDVDLNDKNGLESSARDARYKAFEEAISETNAEAVLLAHNMNDQAEQVILGLVRGSGLRSLSGMREERDSYIRPLLNVSRDIIEDASEGWSLKPWIDPHNSSLDYTRVKIRKNVLPYLKEELEVNVVENLSRSAKLAREDDDSLKFVVDNIISNLTVGYFDKLVIKISEIDFYPIGLRKRILHTFLTNNFNEYFSEINVLDIEELISNWTGQKEIIVPKVRVYRNKNKELVFEKL